jgi:hypothetical protein
MFLMVVDAALAGLCPAGAPTTAVFCAPGARG